LQPHVRREAEEVSQPQDCRDTSLAHSGASHCSLPADDTEVLFEGDRGEPRLAHVETGTSILRHLERLSEPFGTR
jgi:hypothetical protein